LLFVMTRMTRRGALLPRLLRKVPRSAASRKPLSCLTVATDYVPRRRDGRPPTRRDAGPPWDLTASPPIHGDPPPRTQIPPRPSTRHFSLRMLPCRPFLHGAEPPQSDSWCQVPQTEIRLAPSAEAPRAGAPTCGRTAMSVWTSRPARAGVWRGDSTVSDIIRLALRRRAMRCSLARGAAPGNSFPLAPSGSSRSAVSAFEHQNLSIGCRWHPSQHRHAAVVVQPVSGAAPRRRACGRHGASCANRASSSVATEQSAVLWGSTWDQSQTVT